MNIIAGEEYYDIKFTAADFRDHDLTGCVFESCTFVDCMFTGQKLKRVSFLSSSFTRCDLSNVDVSNSKFADIQLTSCKLIGINWSLAEEVRSPDFKDSNLSLSTFRSLKLKLLSIVGCRLHDGDFQDCDLTSSDLSDTDFAGTLFRSCNFTKANFTTARNYQIDPTANKLKGARFSLPEAVGLLTGFDIILE